VTASERIPFHVEINRIIELLAKQIYQSPLALLRENCQNAYDAILLRQHLGQHFAPNINITATATEVSVSDNGIGMTKDDLVQHYWRAGASGKNNPEARAAGVIGTFGIGAMANFGVATDLIVETESAITGERTTCTASRATLSATEDCIQLESKESQNSPGTTVVAKFPKTANLNPSAAIAYVKECVRYIPVPVKANGTLISKEDLEQSINKPHSEWGVQEKAASLGRQVSADVELVVSGAGEVWVGLRNFRYSDVPTGGLILLRQNLHQISTYRSFFALSKAGISSFYSFGGIANSSALEPTAGREALTTASLQLLQSIVTDTERYVSQKIAGTPLADSNTGFMEWVIAHSRYEYCSLMKIRMEPENRSIELGQLKENSKQKAINAFDGTDASLIDQYATEDNPLVVVSTRQPRRKCELAYLRQFCKINWIQNAPEVLSRKSERAMTGAEAAFALRIMSILETDYFVSVRVGYGKISHGLAILVDTSTQPIDIVLDSRSATIATILKLYETDDFMSLTGMAKDFARNVIFPKVASCVPSSTREGAEAFLRAIRRPRDVMEYEKSDLGNLSEIWQEYMEGKLTLDEAARQSSTIVRATVQIFDRGATTSVASVLPDILENERILAESTAEVDEQGQFDPQPAIARLEKESSVKLLTIENDEQPLKGYRCFLALTERVREERGEFFLQPHRTEIVWGGQKVLYIFQHHSGEFGLYYELQGSEVLSAEPGGRIFPTATIVLKNQIYIPVPDELRQKFIPEETGRKRFEIRCELLYPDVVVEGVGSP
jgi:molecular chaperone HtpG